MKCRRCKEFGTGHGGLRWDDAWYCPACVQTICPQLVIDSRGAPQLSEALTPDEIDSRSAFRSYMIAAIVVTQLLFGIPLLICAITGKADMQMTVIVIACLQGIALVAAFFIPRTELSELRSRLPRTLSVHDAHLNVQYANQEVLRVPLDTCAWSEGKASRDSDCRYRARRQAIVLSTPDADFACGLSNESFAAWRDFLTLVGIEKTAGVTSIKRLGIVVLYAVGGASLGLIAGFVVSNVRSGRWWIAFFGILGLILGLWGGTATATWLDSARRQLERLGSASFFVRFALVAGLVTYATGEGALIAGAAAFVSGCAGFVVAELIRKRVWVSG